jgi:5'(3')-deoxyribonucleotidase
MRFLKPSLLLIQGNCIKDIPSTLTFSSFLEILKEKDYEFVPVYGKSNVLTCINTNIIHIGDTLLIFDESGKLNFYSGRVYVGKDTIESFSNWLKN